MRGYVAAALAVALCAGALYTVVTASSSSATSLDGRATAIQKALDAKPPVAVVASGRACHYHGAAPYLDVTRYRHVPDVTVKAAGTRRGGYPPEVMPCFQVTWLSAAHVHTQWVAGPGGLAGLWHVATIGRFVVDKVGAEQNGALGIKMTPYDAHFESNDMGKALIAAGITAAPKNVTDGLVSLHQNADGTWIVE